MKQTLRAEKRHRGYRVAAPRDAICSSSGEARYALLRVYGGRFTTQLDVTDTKGALAAWR